MDKVATICRIIFLLVLVLAGTLKAGIMFGPGKERIAENGAPLAQQVRGSPMALHVDEVVHIVQYRNKLICL